MKRLIRTFFIVSFFTLIVFKTARAQYWKALGDGVGFSVVTEFKPDTFHNKLFVGGNFESAGTTNAHNLAVWDGNEWIKLNVEPSHPVTGLAMRGDTLIYTSGNSTSDQVGMYVDTTFIGNLSEIGGFSNCLFYFHDTLYAGGEFSSGIKYWNGTQWKILGGGIGGISYSVNTIGSYNDELIVGGHFSDAGGIAVNNIATWDGSQWLDMGGGVTYTGDFPEVLALNEYKGYLYVGGSFRDAGDIFTGDIAKWNGNVWDTVHLSSLGSTCGDVRGFFSDNSMLYVTGTISGYLNCMGHRAAMFDGETWYNLFLKDGDSGDAITVFNGDIIVGTDFKYGWNNDTVNYVARFLGYPTTTETTEQNSSPIFPNPASTTITLSLPSNQNAMLSIFNLLGEKVKEEKVTGSQVTLDVSSLPQGVYLVRMENRVVGKFVKE